MTNNPNQHQPDGDGLLPCPFCGGEADLSYEHGAHPDWWKVTCIACGCRTVSNTTKSQKAIDRWNTRKAAPPKPAPDAVREALEPFANIGLDVLKNRPGWANAVFEGKWCDAYPLKYTDFERAAAVAIALRLAAPVPSPDGAGEFPRFLGSSSENGSPRVARCVFAADLSDEDHRKIATALIYAFSPSPAVAVEPVRELECVLNSLMLAVHDNEVTYPLFKTRLRKALKEVLQPLYATPPVRGDREAMQKARDYIEYSLETHGNDVAGNGLAALNALDSALSLPVQPAPDHDTAAEIIAQGIYGMSVRDLEGVVMDNVRNIVTKIFGQNPNNPHFTGTTCISG